MLVLTRRVGQVIHIDNHIQVMLVGIHGNQVRLGITAPASVSVLREELLPERSQHAGANAAATATATATATAGTTASAAAVPAPAVQ
jgi:carbon storage regulator